MTAQRPIFDPERITPPRKSAPPPHLINVSQLNTMIKRALSDNLPKTIHLIGEISNLTKPASGHLYLTLKDEHSEIRAVMWRSAAATLKFKPQDGMEIIATGQIDLYEPRGQYQFYIRKLEPRGTGALELAFRQLQDWLAREGLFKAEHKKDIPAYPQRVAVVTSDSGAAVRDIIKTISNRYPCANLLIHPVRVQGEEAAADIAEALGRLNQQAHSLGGIDTIILGRGGGSLEDLWPFNEEIVARAVFNSKIPIISAVGHETDTTIADLVADLRAPTPTAAAEMAVPKLNDILEILSDRTARLKRILGYQLEDAQTRLNNIQRAEWFRNPIAIILRQEQRIDELISKLQLRYSNKIGLARQIIQKGEIVIAKIQPAAFVQLQQSRLQNLNQRIRSLIHQQIRLAKYIIGHATQKLLAASPQNILEMNRVKISQSTHNLNRVTNYRIKSTRQKLQALSARIEATGYRQTLARGYTITRLSRDKTIISSAGEVAPGQKIVTETAQGEFESQVTETEHKKTPE